MGMGEALSLAQIGFFFHSPGSPSCPGSWSPLLVLTADPLICSCSRTLLEFRAVHFNYNAGLSATAIINSVPSSYYQGSPNPAERAPWAPTNSNTTCKDSEGSYTGLGGFRELLAWNGKRNIFWAEESSKTPTCFQSPLLSYYFRSCFQASHLAAAAGSKSYSP